MIKRKVDEQSEKGRLGMGFFKSVRGLANRHMQEFDGVRVSAGFPLVSDEESGSGAGVTVIGGVS